MYTKLYRFILSIEHDDYTDGFEVVSKRCGINYNTLYRYATGERIIPFDVLLRIANEFETQPEKLVGTYCPTCSEILPSKNTQFDRLGLKTSTRVKEGLIYDCNNCGYIHFKQKKIQIDDEIKIHLIEGSYVVTDHIQAFRKENRLNWYDIVQVEFISLLENVLNKLVLKHKDIVKEIYIYPLSTLFENSYSYSPDDVEAISGTNSNGRWEIITTDPIPFLLLYPGSKITKKSTSKDEVVNFFRNEIIKSEHSKVFDDYYEILKPCLIRDPELAEKIVKGEDSADIYDWDKLWSLYEDKPETVKSYSDVVENAKIYQKYINDKGNFFYKNMSKTRYWLYIEEIDSFIANKFAAYENNSYIKYKYFTNKNNDKMDGGHARRILAKFFKETSDAEIIKKFNEFKKNYSIKETSNIQKAVLLVRKND